DAGAAADTARFVSLSVDAAGKVFLDDRPVTDAELATRLAQSAAASRDTEVQLRADETVPYGRVVALMGIANKAGLSRVGFVTQPPARKP
ncbi:MAG: biopolymer transporter ExbD, partial [Gammaproteobacteria bacterium]|nr:biopolymer transporter ExbD [Gammaproteobacteria bacterium]